MSQQRIIEPLFFTLGEDGKAYSQLSIDPMEINQVVITINGVADDPFYNMSRAGRVIIADGTLLDDFHTVKADYWIQTENELLEPLSSLAFSQYAHIEALKNIAEKLDGLFAQQSSLTANITQEEEQVDYRLLSLRERLVAQKEAQIKTDVAQRVATGNI